MVLLSNFVYFEMYPIEDTISTPHLPVQLLMGLLFSLLSILGLLGNILVCVAVYTNKKLRKKENLYFVSLAIADLLVTLLVMPFAAFNDILGRWLFGRYCKVWMTLDIMLCTSSNLHLCAISFDRYYHIYDPMRYKRRMSTRKILAAICCVWSLSALIAFSPIIFDRAQFRQTLVLIWNNSSSDGLQPYYGCRFNLEPIYAIVSSLISFYLPCFIMIFAYGKLYKQAQRHALTIWHQLQAMTSFLVSVASQQALGDDSCSSKWMKKRRLRLGPIRADRKARITLGAIMGAFIIAWLPFFIFNILKSLCGVVCVPDWLFVTCTWLGYANSAQNPIIYSTTNRDFRQTFRRILGCEKKRRNWTNVKERKKKSMKMNQHPPQDTQRGQVERLFTKRTIRIVKVKRECRSI